MKVYVDELPKCCEECDLRAENDTGCGYCAVKEYYEDTPKAYETCPLQSLTEHDKQVRKEVVQEIRQQLKEVERFHPEDDFEIDYDYYYKEDVDGILEKVEKGE